MSNKLNQVITLSLFLGTIVLIRTQDPAIPVLFQYLASLNQSQLITAASVFSLQNQVTNLQDQVNFDYSILSGRIRDAATNLSIVSELVTSNANSIIALTAATEDLKAGLDAANEKIKKLQSVNLIWKANFRVVNKTFSELRRKVKFVVPMNRIAYLPGNKRLPNRG